MQLVPVVTPLVIFPEILCESLLKWITIIDICQNQKNLELKMPYI